MVRSWVEEEEKKKNATYMQKKKSTVCPGYPAQRATAVTERKHHGWVRVAQKKARNHERVACCFKTKQCTEK